jgi:hypothetical protein
MIKAYIAGPIRKGDLATNIKRATDIACAFAKLGYAIMVPQLSCWFDATFDKYDGDFPRAEGRLNASEWIAIDLAWVEVSDVLIRITGDSEGADQEVLHAEHCGIPWFCVNSVEDVADVHMQIQNMEEIAI